MQEVIVLVEGQTEERFIKQIVAPTLHGLRIYLKPQLVSTSPTGRGGALTIDRFLRHARNTLRQKPQAVLSSFIDLYALDTDFPRFQESRDVGNVYKRVELLEQALHALVVQRTPCRTDRFVPHIQPHEFEGLLFANVDALASTEPTWAKALSRLRKVRSAFESPEHINDGYETKPSKRLENLLHPKYRKTTHGPRIAARISLETIEQECAHFRHWMNRLRGLHPS